MISYIILGLSIGLVIGALVALGVAAVVLMDTIQLYEAKIKELEDLIIALSAKL